MGKQENSTRSTRRAENLFVTRKLKNPGGDPPPGFSVEA